MAQQKQPEASKALGKLLDGFSLEDLIEANVNLRDLREIAQKVGPQTKEELWWWFKEKIGVELARVSVCEGHTCQLDVAWEIYNFDVTRVLLVFDRGGSKTSLMAWLDDCQCEHFPGFETFTIGPGKTQGQRKYDHLLPLVVEGGIIGGKELDHVIRSTSFETQWKNGSKMEIALGGTPSQANGPRTPRLHRDETELMDPDTYKQAGNIPAGRRVRDGRYVPAQIVDTSTMKQAGGRVDTMIEEYNEAILKGVRPRMEVRISCVYESARENPYCRSVPEDERRDRLGELGLDPDKICDCDSYVSGVWETDDPNSEARPRTLESVCQGRFFRSRGFKEFDDVHTSFLECNQQTWESEKECSQPARDGAYLKSYSQIRHGIKGYMPDPENGPIYGGVDWGGDDEHSAGLYQLLTRDVEVTSWKSGQKRVQPAGSLIRFAEIFKRDIGNIELGNMVKEMEDRFRLMYPGFVVRERYPDSANRAGRLDWRDVCGLQTVSRIKKDFLEEVKLVRSRVGGYLFAVDIDACPIFDKSLRSWRQKNGHEVHDQSSHAMAEFRYVEHNLHVVYRHEQKKMVGTGSPVGAAGDAEARTPERAEELAGRVKVIDRRQNHDAVVVGDVGSDPSPLSTERSKDKMSAGLGYSERPNRRDWRM